MEKSRIRDPGSATPFVYLICRLTNTRLEHVPELHLPGLLSLDLSANYLADLDCAALEILAQARTHGHPLQKKNVWILTNPPVIVVMKVNSP